MIYLYTDGAFSQKLKQGGAGYIFYENQSVIAASGMKISGHSNNFAEVAAAILAFSTIVKPIDNLTLVSDSMYLIGCGWLGWTRNKNLDLWKLFDKEWMRAKSLITSFDYKHVNGHQTDNSIDTIRNNQVDKLAVYYSQLN